MNGVGWFCRLFGWCVVDVVWCGYVVLLCVCLVIVNVVCVCVVMVVSGVLKWVVLCWCSSYRLICGLKLVSGMMLSVLCSGLFLMSGSGISLRLKLFVMFCSCRLWLYVLSVIGIGRFCVLSVCCRFV